MIRIWGTNEDGSVAEVIESIDSETLRTDFSARFAYSSGYGYGYYYHPGIFGGWGDSGSTSVGTKPSQAVLDGRVYFSDLAEKGIDRFWIEGLAAPEFSETLTVRVYAGVTFNRLSEDEFELDPGVDPEIEETSFLAGVDSVDITVIEPAAPSNDGSGLRQTGDGISPETAAFNGPLRLDGRFTSLAGAGISGDPFAWDFGHRTQWTNDIVASSGSLAGPGHIVSDLPFLVSGSSSVIAVFSPTDQRVFDRIGGPGDEAGGEFRSRFFGRDQLAIGAGEITLVDSAGNTFTFFGFDAEGDPAKKAYLQQGQIKEITTAGGQKISFIYDDQGRLDSSSQVLDDGVTQTLEYKYADPITASDRAKFRNPDQDPADLTHTPYRYRPSLRRVTLKRGDTAIKAINYYYYQDNQVDRKIGRLGDLKYTEIVYHENGNPKVVDRNYYRHFSHSSQPANSLDSHVATITVLDNRAWARSGWSLTQLDTVIRDVDLKSSLGATKTKVSRDFLDQDRFAVSTVDTHGHGSGGWADLNTDRESVINDSGSRIFKVHAERHTEIGPNAARYTATYSAVGFPQETYTLNAARQILRHIVTSGESTWVTNYLYDADGRLKEVTSPGGLTTYYDYFESGAKQGLLKQTGVKRGNQNAALTQFDYKLYGNTFRVSRVTEVNGNNSSITHYTYGGANGSKSRTTTLPVVSTAQNGTGKTDTITETFDKYGNLISIQDADGTHLFDYHFSNRTLNSTSGGLTTTTVYDPYGQIHKVTNADGTGTKYDIDLSVDGSTTVATDFFGGSEANAIETTAIESSYTDGTVNTTVKVGSQVISKSIDQYDKGGRLIESRVLWAVGVKYLPLERYGYNKLGIQHKTQRFTNAKANSKEFSNLDSIVEETVYDDLGRVEALKRGGKTYQEFEYDGGGVGDGNVTKITLKPGTGPNRVTTNVYDWRNRLVASKEGDLQVGYDNSIVNRPLTVYRYDNQDQIIETLLYDGDSITPSYHLATDTVVGLNAAELELKTVNRFDTRGQVYQTQIVDQDAQHTNTSGYYYDALGRVILEAQPGGLFVRTIYNARGQVSDTTVYTGNPLLVGTTVTVALEHTHHDYDAGGRVIFTKTTERNTQGHDPARVVSQYYDAQGRLKTVVNHGDIQSRPVNSRPAKPPVRSSKNQRTDYAYSPDQLTTTVTTTSGVAHASERDGLGRVILVRSNSGQFIPVVDSDKAVNLGPKQTDAQQLSGTTYDGLGRVRTSIQSEIGSLTDHQRQTYDYENDGTGSYTVNFNPTANSETNLFRKQVFNQLGELVITETNTTLDHTYTYDVVGRLVRDSTSRETQQTVIANSGSYRNFRYDVFGNTVLTQEFLHQAISPRSEVSQEFNAFGQILSSTSTVAGVSHGGITYTYENANGGVRPTGALYNDGSHTVVSYEYSGFDSTFNRITSLSADGKQLESYQYLGIETPQRITKHLDNDNVVVEQFVWDHFGRTKAQRWEGTDLSFKYEYNFANQLTMINDVTSVNFDQVFRYDNVGNRTSASAGGQETHQFRTDDTGLNRDIVADPNPLVGPNTTQRLSQQDAVRPVYQGFIDSTDSEHTLNYYLENWHQGLTGHQFPPSANSLQFDAWERVVERKYWNVTHNPNDHFKPSFSRSLTFTYDAVGNLVQQSEVTKFGFSNPGRTTLVNDGFGNVISEHFLDNQGGSASSQQFVWSPVTGNLVYRKFFHNHNTALDGREDFVAVDAQNNVVGLIKASDGALAVRWYYEPTGRAKLVPGVDYPEFSFPSLKFSQLNLDFHYLYQQGRYVEDIHGVDTGITSLPGGQQHDSLLGGLVTVNAQAFNDDVANRDYQNVQWWEEYSAQLHTSLGAAGLSPGIGVLADGADSLLYIIEGNYFQAGLSAGAALPGLGYAFNSIRYANNATKLYNASRALDVSVNLLQSGVAINQGAQNGSLTQIGIGALGFGVNGSIAALRATRTISAIGDFRAPRITLNADSIAALKAAGLDDAAIARQLEVLGDIHVFRGTTQGFAGNPVLQKLGISPASIDPVVATTFAAEGASRGVNPTILFGRRAAFGETLGFGNVRSVLEREITVGLSPTAFAARAPNSVSLARARSILKQFGIDVPASFRTFDDATRFLEGTRRLTPEETLQFIRQATGQ